jgi:hypothetical protein
MNTKVCTGFCGRELPATTEFFHKKKNGKYGFNSECRECFNKRQKERNIPVNTDVSIKQTCTGICLRELPATTEFFHKNKKGKYGIHRECRECCNKRQKEKRNNPPNTDVSIKQTCIGCGNELPATLDYFYRDRRGKFGVHTFCMACQNKKLKEYSKTPKGRAVIKNAQAKRRAQKRTQVQFLGRGNLDLIAKVYQYCPKGYEVDHMLALAKGGDHHESNLCYLPKRINRAKGDRSIEEFGVDIFNKNVIYWQDLLQV